MASESEPPVRIVNEGDEKMADRGPVRLGRRFSIPPEYLRFYQPPGSWR